MDSLSENANVIVEDGDGAKRFPAKNLGGVKTVNGVAPDETGDVELICNGGLAIEDDGNGNVTIEHSDELLVSDDGNGNVTIEGMTVKIGE